MITRFVRLVTLFVALLAFQFSAAWAESVGQVPTAQPRHKVEQIPGPALWKVTDKDTTIYLFGTVHALPKDTDWYKPHVKAAFEASDELVTEVSMQDLDSVSSAMAAQATLPQGQDLRDLLNPQDRMAFESAMVGLGLPVGTFDRYKPWAAAFFLSLLPVQAAGFEADQGVDVKLTQMAGPNVKHTALETAAFQLGLFDGLPQAKQVEYLRAVVRSIPEIAPQIKEIAGEWVTGDTKGLARTYQSDNTDALLHDKLITDRNRTWAHWIKQRLKQPGTVFVAVGAGHLAGRGCLQDQLGKLGIHAKRVK